MIRIINLNGDVLKEFKLEDSMHVETQLTLSDISSGIYLIEVEINQEKYYTGTTRLTVIPTYSDHLQMGKNPVFLPHGI